MFRKGIIMKILLMYMKYFVHKDDGRNASNAVLLDMINTTTKLFTVCSGRPVNMKSVILPLLVQLPSCPSRPYSPRFDTVYCIKLVYIPLIILAQCIMPR